MVDRKRDGAGASEGAKRGSLPRGRHGLPADQVEQNQRRRVAEAAARLITEGGYDAVTVERLQRGAGISRSTFYERYANKQDAVRAAYDRAVKQFLDRLQGCGADQVDQPTRVRLAISTALEFAIEEPEQAQLLAGYSLCADLALARHVFASHDRIARELCGPSATSTAPGIGAQALLGAVGSILARYLIAGESQRLAALEETLTVALSPYLGPEQDRRSF